MFSITGITNNMKISLLTLLPISLLLSFAPFVKEANPLIILFNAYLLMSYLVVKHPFFSVFIAPYKKYTSIYKFILMGLNLLLMIKIYGFHLTQDISIALLISMLCLKILEIKNENDTRNIIFIIYLQFFLTACSFLSSQSLGNTLYAIFIVLFLSLLMMLNSNPLLLKNNHKRGFKTKLLIKTTLKISALAVPITLVLFILFPRIPGPLWTLPNLASSGTTGLSDSMSPGSINNLSDSAEIVFRINFAGNIPKASELYWRGPILTQTDGFFWTQEKIKQGQARKKPADTFLDKIQNEKQLINYTITLEPQKQKWLFTLEMPKSVSSQFVRDAYLSKDMQFLVKHPISRVVQYQASSYLSFNFTSNNKNELTKAKRYPLASNPKTLQLGKKWRQLANKIGSDDFTIVNKGLNYFIEQDFYYTRKPPIMTKNPADEFLFQYKRGFCEHFASSFVLLMRASGIPARVVTGYQGMEYNKLGKYYLVRQSNAHAWAEVWLQNKGWVRIDPTAIIPQDHIENDIFDYKNNELNFLNLNYSDLQKLAQRLKQLAWAENLLLKAKQSIDLLQYSWNNWVLGYDQNKQQSLLALLGLDNNYQTLILLLTSLSLGFVGIYFYFNLIRTREADKLKQVYLIFLNMLQKQGLNYTPHDGPEALKKRSIALFPVREKQLKKIFNYYIQLRYANISDNYSLKVFKQILKEYKKSNISSC